MSLESVMQQINPTTAQAFVRAARHVIDALLIEGQRVRAAQGPEMVDYETAGLPREAPAGGWIADDELRAGVQQMSEAIAAEKWVEGAVFAIRVLVAMGGGL